MGQSGGAYLPHRAKAEARKRRRPDETPPWRDQSPALAVAARPESKRRQARVCQGPRQGRQGWRGRRGPPGTCGHLRHVRAIDGLHGEADRAARSAQHRDQGQEDGVLLVGACGRRAWAARCAAARRESGPALLNHPHPQRLRDAAFRCYYRRPAAQTRFLFFFLLQCRHSARTAAILNLCRGCALLSWAELV